MLRQTSKRIPLHTAVRHFTNRTGCGKLYEAKSSKKYRIQGRTYKNMSKSNRTQVSAPLDTKGGFIRILGRLKSFELDKSVSNWWKHESAAAKAAFLSALIIGFISHLFVYTGRYFGRDDMGMIYRLYPMVGTGRWFNTIISKLSYGYIIPLVSGILVSFFLAAAAFFICKIFNIHKKFNAVLAAGLLSAFPSIANTNLFLYDAPNYQFAVMLGAVAVYMTIKLRFGFLPGAVLAMLTLAIYQSKFNVVVTLALLYLMMQLLDDSVKLKDILAQSALKLASMVMLGGIFYAVSLPISFRVFNTTFNNYRGMSPDSLSDRLLSVSGIINALKSTYRSFYDGFFGNIYLVVKELRYAYVLLIALSVLFVLSILISKKLYKQYLRLLFIAALALLLPLACNFAGFFDTGDTYGLMIYAFVLPIVFCVMLSERCVNILPVLRSIFSLCVIFIIGNYIIGNNVYYLKAYVYNQRTTSLSTRILAKIDPLIPLSSSKKITFFGDLPNEYYTESTQVFREYGTVKDGSALGATSYINYGIPNNSSLALFAANFDRMHGVRLNALGLGEERDHLADEILRQNMPAWPAEGSVNIIDDVIIVNFGLADAVLEEDADGQFFRARHYISEGHAQHSYEYSWQVYRNGNLIDSPVTSSAILRFDINSDDSYRVDVTIRNTATGFRYPKVTLNIRE